MRQGLTVAFSTRSAGPHIARYIRHLHATSGVERLEVLYRVNPGKYSLTELYNQFLAQASHPLVCLIHDDLRFARGSAWGRRLLQAFTQWPDYAVLAPAGSISLGADGIYWQSPGDMVGEVNHRLPGHFSHNRYSVPFEHPREALVLDGLMLAVHKDRISTGFDQRLPGFHFYDISFSLTQTLAHQGGKCGVLTGLGVTHLSGGKPDAAFYQARDQFLESYGSLLPRQLRPELNLLPLMARTSETPSLLVIVWYHDARFAITPLLDRLKSNASFLIFNSTDQTLPPGIQSLPAPGLSSWADLNPLLLEHLQSSDAELVLLLDNRVLPLQDWLPAMLADFRTQPRLGTLGVRLHYPDSHRVAHNGLELFRHPDGQPDVAIRGIHQAYPYQNALEWVPSGSLAQALMLRRELFLQLGGLAGQNWLPGLELNLRAAAAGWRNAVDSRLAGYLLAEDEVAEEQYLNFLKTFADWLGSHKSLAQLCR